MKKRLFSLFTSLIMVISLLGVMPTMSVGALESGDYEYEILDGGTVEITAYNGTATELTIPSTIDDKKVTSIGGSAFYDCDSLTGIIIPDSVTSIGDYAFYDCNGITSVTIGNSVTSIGDGAFYYCDILTSITIPDSVTSIGDWAFSDCYSLTSITIPDSVTSIGDSAFEYCDSLTSVTIGNSVTSIGDRAFRYCDSLTSINVNANNKYYSSVDGVLFNKNKTELIQYPIGNKRNSYTIPDSVTSIGDWAFYYCESLTSVTIPDSVTSIGEYAFAWCDSLTSITIPDSVTSIGDEAFTHCYSLTSINVNTNNKYYSSVDGVLFNKNKTELIQYPIGNKRNSYTIPDSVTSIGAYAFEYCESLTSVTIPDSVTSIGNSAFADCYSLTSITIPDSVTSIGEDAFADCDSLTSITIPDSVTSIGEYAFASCDSLTSVTIPDSVTSIGSYAFWYCTSLSSVTIPDSVTSIGEYAFSDCDSLTIKCYENSTAHQYAIDNYIPYELLSDETKLEGKVYCQFKDNNTMMRFIAEVDIEDVTNANSGEITVSYNEEVLEVKSITGAYKSLYAGGQVITAPEGKCYIISNQYTGFMYDDMMSVEFTLDNYDLGLSRDVIIN